MWGLFLEKNMMIFRNILRWGFYYGGLITYFLSSHEIEEEEMEMTVACHPELTAKLIDVTRKKALYTPHMTVFSAKEKQVRDDNIMARMFGMAELQ